MFIWQFLNWLTYIHLENDAVSDRESLSPGSQKDDTSKGTYFSYVQCLMSVIPALPWFLNIW